MKRKAEWCPWCLKRYPCPTRCRLVLAEPKKVVTGDGFVLVGPGAFVIKEVSGPVEWRRVKP